MDSEKYYLIGHFIGILVGLDLELLVLKILKEL